MDATLTQVLLIEDNRADGRLLSEALGQDTRSAFEVTYADHLKTAIQLLSSRQYDVILLDLNVPDSQGLDTFIKIHRVSPDTPVVVLSGLMDEEIAFQAIHLGAQDYLVKRQEAWEIAARTIRYAIERQRSKVALRDSESRFRNLFEHAPVAYLSLDRNGFYLDFNGQLLDLLGYTSAELVGNSFVEQWSAESKPSFSRKFTRFMQDGEINADVQLVRKDGALIEVLMEGKVQYDSDRQFVQAHAVLFDITARKLAEQVLRETQEKFSAVFRSNPLGISITELAEGIIIDTNESFLNMLGYARTEVLRRSPIELNMWPNPEEHARDLKVLRMHGEVTNTETSLRRKDGEIVHALASYRLIELDGKHYVLNMLNDITDRKQKEQALIDSERRFLSLIENGLENISLITANGDLLWESPAVIRTLDYEPDAFVGQNILDLVHSDDREKISRQFAELVQEPGSRRRDSFRLRRSDGAWRWVEAVATNLLNEPNINAIVINYHDITERIQTEEKLRESQKRLSMIFRHSPIGIVVTRLADGRILDANPAFASFHGYTSDEIIGQSSIELNMWAIPAERAALAKQLLEKGTCHDMDIKARKKDGEICDLRISAEMIELAGEKVCLGLGQEFTEQKRAEEILRENEEKYRSLIESSVSVIATINHDGDFDFINRVAAQQLGRQPAEVVGKNMFDLFPREQAEQQLQRIQQVIETNTGLTTESPTVVNGQTRWYQNNIQPLRNRSGEAVLALLNATDITERKQNELDLKVKASEFAALYETTLDLSLESDISKLLQQIVERTNKLLESSGGFIYLYDPAQNDLVLTVAAGFGQPIGMRLKIGEGMAGRVAASRESLIIDDYQNWQSRADAFADQPFRSIVEVPMISGGELIGVLGVEQYEDSTRKFNDQDARLLALFAGYAAGAVRNARLLHEANANAQQLSFLYDAGLVLNHELDPQIQLDLLFGIVQHALKADSAVFFRYDETSEDLRIQSGVGMAMDLAELKELRFKLGEEAGLVGLVARNRAPFYLPDVRQDPRWINVDAETHTVLWVPIEYEKHLVGVLSVSSIRLDAFSQQAQQLVVLFANQIAIAMENARLFDALQNELREREQAERALSESESLHRQAIEVAGAVPYHESYYDNGRSIKYEFIGEGIRNLTGYGPEEFSATVWDSLVLDVHPIKDLAGYSVDEAIQRVRSGENPVWKCEHRIRHRSGEIRWIFEAAVELRDEDGVSRGSIGMYQDITESKQSEAALRKGEERYRGIFEGVQDAILVESMDGRILDVNQRACEMFGYSREQFLTKVVNDLIPAGQPAIAADEDGLEAISHGPLETIDIRANGEEFPVEISGRLYDFDDQKVFLVVLRDISERKQAEKAMRERDQSYKTLIDQTPAIVYIDDSSTDPGRTQFVSPYIQTMLGFTPEEWITGGETLWKDRLHSEDRERVLAEYESSIQTTTPLSLEYRIYAKDGRVVWVQDQATTLRDEAGKPHSVHGVMYDITERKQTEASLRESEQRFRSLFNTSPDAIMLIDPHDPIVPWRVLDCNEAACRMNGYTLEELVGQSVDMLSIAPQVDEERHAYLDHLRHKGAMHAESTHRHKNGDIFPIEISTSLLILEGRELVLRIDRDVTERRRTESERQALLEIMAGAGSTTDLAEYLKLVHHSIAKMIWAENFFVILHNKETDQFEEIYTVDQFDPPQPPSKLEKSISAYVFRSGKSLLLTESLFEELAARGEVALVGTNSPSWLGVPLITPKETIGVMVVQDYERANQYSEGDQDFLTSIAGQVSLAVERIRAETEITHQLSELEALYENGLAISSMFEPRQIANRIVQVLDQKMKWHHAAVRILHPESGRLELLALSQPGLNKLQIDEQIERVNQFNINLDYGLSGWVVKHRTALRSGNLKENPIYVETYPGIKSGLYVPIQSGEAVIGSIAVESEQENAFAERDERLLMTLATQAAISFTNAQLYERLQHELIERRRTEDQILKLNAELEQRVHERTLEIEAAHQRFELATASSGIGVWELKSGVDTFYWDERMHDIYGTEPQRFIPTVANWLGFVHPDDREAEAEKTSRAITQPGTHQSEFRIIREDGSVRYVNSHAIVRVDGQSSFKDMIGVHIDITTIKEAEETLRMGNSELERALRMKDEFLANMSHELRTPLNAILGLSESLEEQIVGSLNEKQQRYIHTISESGHHLLTLINDILDLAKIEAGQIKLDINKVDIHAVCQSSLRMVRQLAQKKDQRVEFAIDDKLNLIWADERRLKQMMVNLLSNAVKFTAAGGQIGLDVHAHEAENQVLITVWDSGIGIKENELAHLFQPFVQLDAGLARESSGTGLGLALVAQMARLHGGSVSVTSQPGVGSRFMITLPWEPALPSDTLSRMKITGKFRVVKPGSESNGQTILLIEDTEEVVMMLKDYLESAAYRVVTAQNGIEGIAQAKKFHPDLILMDVQMPGMDGLEATQKLRSDREFQNTPIIALTAFAMQNDRERCLAAGMNEYLSKPVNMKTLLKVVQSFLAAT